MNKYLVEPNIQAVILLGLAMLLGVLALTVPRAYRKLMGKLRMRRRNRFNRRVGEALEDVFVNAVSQASAPREVINVYGEKVIEPPRITIEDARQLYARLAHLGFWGLHPRKFTPIKTDEDLHELKERLKSVRAAREASNKSFDTMLDDLATQLNLKGA